MKIPHTYLSTRFRPGKRAIRRRLADLFAPARRRGTVPLLLVLFCVAGLGALVACMTGGTFASIPFLAFLNLPFFIGPINGIVVAMMVYILLEKAFGKKN